MAPFGKVKAQEAAEALAKEAWARWIQEEGRLAPFIYCIYIDMCILGIYIYIILYYIWAIVGYIV